MKSVAFFNNKGGVGKTTLLCNVAAFMSIYQKYNICIIDADPQCNATQYLFSESIIEKLYNNNSPSFTIHDVIEPLSLGEGYSQAMEIRRSNGFKVDVIPGDPRLALTEDLLAKDWGAALGGDVRGIRTNLVFSELLSRLEQYDFVFFDVSPSLGAINRSILLSSDYFVSPMSIDIFSLKAFENIGAWIEDWSLAWKRGIENVKDKKRVPEFDYGSAKFIGYVTQQYMAKRDSQGKRRAVQAYERIRSEIDGVIREHLSIEGMPSQPFEIGTVPNLFSLIPMSQTNHTPVFELQARHGVVGAHFAKVQEAKSIFGSVARSLSERLTND